MRDKISLCLIKLILRIEGWTKVKRGWRYREMTILGDGSDVLRMVARRLFAGEKIRKSKKSKNHDKPT